MIAAMARRRISDERTLTAYHEAGHAAISLWLGVPFQSATIISTEDSIGRVVPQVVRWFRPDLWWDRNHDDLLRCTTQILLAGPEAERRVKGSYHSVGASSDWQRANELAGTLHYSEAALRAFVRYSTAVVREAFDNELCWRIVESLTGELLSLDQLTYRVARRVAGEAVPPVRRWNVPKHN